MNTAPRVANEVPSTRGMATLVASLIPMEKAISSGTAMSGAIHAVARAAQRLGNVR